MFIDSHCHLDFPELAENLPTLLANMKSAQVTHALCVCVELEAFDAVLNTAKSAANLFASVGVHPDYPDCQEPSVADLVERARDARVVAIGETGLDYFRLEGDLEWQRERFRTHIRAAKEAGKPLIVHTRRAPEDTLRILKEEGAAEVGGVMHCFTESYEVAAAAMDMNFMISFSGIVSFKNARDLHDVARRTPLECMLIETDSPYLAPVPFRGKTNQPAYVAHVAERIAELKGESLARVGAQTSANFFRLFKEAHA
jgi:TatD DNase family protein